MTARRLLYWLQQVLTVVGIACLGYFGLVWADRELEQRRENRELDRILQSRAAARADAPMPAPTAGRRVERDRTRATPRAVLGRLEIPRLGVSATVREGDDARTLRQAIGHIPGTALPGGQGNAGLAAHRDTFFRRLADIRRRDQITFTAPDGVHRYVVQDTRIVEPTEVSVLDETDAATLTLVTCYPFNYVGSAPKRFIVRAVRRGDDTASAAAPAAHVAAPPSVQVRETSVQVRETIEVARPLTKPIKRKAPGVRAARAAGGDRHARANGNPVSRFFKAAARGLGLAPRDGRAAARSESPDPRSQRH